MVNLGAQKPAIVVGDLKNVMIVVVGACQKNKCAVVLVYQQDDNLPEWKTVLDYKQERTNCASTEDNSFISH